jgi:hypothetical protein
MKCPIYNQKVGKYTYIIKADSVWDKLKGRSVRKDIERIGTIDADTGEAYYTEKYIDELRAEGQPTENLKSWEDARKAKKFTKAKVLKMIDVSLESLTNPGLSLFFDKLSIEIGLDKALQKAFSGEWHKVLVIASFMLVAKRPIMDCENWAETVGYQQLGSLTSQNISVIFRNITDEQRNALSDFYSDNMSYLERMAIDSTTVSTHSGQIGYAEYGKNKDNDHMKQVDVCFCFGTTSGLPVKIYYLNGSLTDVTTLKEVVAQFPPTLYAKNPLVIADRGYWSYDNVADLLHHELSFLIPSKLDSKFIISLIEKLRPTIETEGEVIINQGKRMLYRTIKASYAGGELFFHVIYDETKRYAEWIKLKDKVDTAFDIISSNPSTTISNKKYLCYLNFDKEDKNKVISINTEAINNAVKLEGWVIFASNTNKLFKKLLKYMIIATISKCHLIPSRICSD